MFRWGVMSSASAKSTIVAWFAYMRRRRGATSPLPDGSVKLSPLRIVH